VIKVDGSLLHPQTNTKSNIAISLHYLKPASPKTSNKHGSKQVKKPRRRSLPPGREEEGGDPLWARPARFSKLPPKKIAKSARDLWSSHRIDRRLDRFPPGEPADVLMQIR